jgi:hypothetical protein
MSRRSIPKGMKYLFASAAFALALGLNSGNAFAVDDLPDDHYTECSPHSVTQDICYDYQLDFLTWLEYGIADYFIIAVYFVPTGGGETPPPDGIE